MPEIHLSVIIPAYNEEMNISGTLVEVGEYLKGKDFVSEVIVVDDGSEDATIQKAQEFSREIDNFRLIESKPNRGKGYVLRKGMLEANGKYLMYMDADNSTSIKELDKFLPLLEEGYDVVIGSRRLKESRVTVPESALRIFMGNAYILISKIMLGARVSDFNCGFKAYRKEAAKRIFTLQKMDDWSYDTELIFLIFKMGMKIKEEPVTWAHKDTSKVKPLKAGIDSFLSLIKIKVNSIKGVYEE